MKTIPTNPNQLKELHHHAANPQATDRTQEFRQAVLALDVDEYEAGDFDIPPDDDYVFGISYIMLVPRRKYDDWLADLPGKFPWLPAGTCIDIAPGHMEVVEKYLEKVCRLLCGKPVEFLAIQSSIHRFPTPNIDPGANVGEGQTRSIDLAKEIFVSHPVCALCGASTPEVMRHRAVCEMHLSHAELGVLFADDITREISRALVDRQKAQHQDDENDNEQSGDDSGPDETPAVDDADDLPSHIVRMYWPAALDLVEKNTNSRDRDTRNRLQGLVKHIREAGPLKQVATLPDDWQARLDTLNEAFPNFGEYVDTLRSQLALASIGDRAIRLLPTILNGPAGIGKSEILSRLAHLFGLPQPLKIDFATAQTGSMLTGSDSHWGNSSEGLLFRTLMLGQYANPLILIDEIDKSNNEGRYNPCAALYGLLERTSAVEFEDLSVRGLKINASHVLWVASANDVTRLDAPIRSRFTVIDVPKPTVGQTRSIQASIWKGMLADGELGIWFDPGKPLSSGTLDALAGLSPREAKQALKMAAGMAVAANSREVRPEDVRIPGVESKKGRQIGFLGDV